jgi:hypothetical protein
MKIVISESQLDSIFSKLLKVPVNDNLINKIKNKFGEDLDSIARLILVAIKENKAEKVTHEESERIEDDEYRHFYINKFPITIKKRMVPFDHSLHPYDYTLKFPVLGTEGEISGSLGKKIFNSLIVK